MRPLLLLVIAAVLASCGSSGPATTTAGTTAAATSTAAEPAKLAEPKGKLSSVEYRAVRGAYVRLAKVEHLVSLAQAVRVTRRGCRPLDVQTELVRRLKSVCAQAARVFNEINGVKVHKRECMQALNAGDVSCYSNLFRRIGRAARVGMVRERALNAEVRHRRLRGRCAEVLVSTEEDLENDDAITHDAISAANAAERRDGAAYMRALTRLEHDLDQDSGDSARESLRKLRSCV